MVNRERVVNEFVELVSIDSLSFNERVMADTLKAKLEKMGFEVYEDDAGKKAGGNTGNIICTVRGKSGIPAILLMAHMDTVVPGTGKKPVVDGNMIRSDGTTILGGDDAAGIVTILEALRVVKEDGIEHGDIQVAFTIAEEAGLYGAKNLDYSRIYAKYGFVLDDGVEIGNVSVQAPSQNQISVVLNGRAAHAGMEPEKGISAIGMAADAISHMQLGRIDDETTANIGVIAGGRATNIVCDRVEIKAEARSRSLEKLERQTDHMRKCFEEAAGRFGGSVEFKAELAYPSFNIKDDAPIMNILRKGAAEAGIKLNPKATGGGSDTNIINGRGIQAVDLSVGMDKVHTTDEQICIDHLVSAAEFLVAVIKNVE